MRNSEYNLYCEKITILNKIKGKDREDGKDLWLKHVYDSAAWTSKSTSGVSGTTVILGTKVIVLLSDLTNYKPYKEFHKFEDYGGYFTISLNDYIVLGDIHEDIDSTNITKVLSKYEPDVMKVQVITKVPNRGFNTALMKLEGV